MSLTFEHCLRTSTVDNFVPSLGQSYARLYVSRVSAALHILSTEYATFHCHGCPMAYTLLSLRLNAVSEPLCSCHQLREES